MHKHIIILNFQLSILNKKRGCVIIDYGHLWCTLLLYIV